MRGFYLFELLFSFFVLTISASLGDAKKKEWESKGTLMEVEVWMSDDGLRKIGSYKIFPDGVFIFVSYDLVGVRSSARTGKLTRNERKQILEFSKPENPLLSKKGVVFRCYPGNHHAKYPLVIHKVCDLMLK